MILLDTNVVSEVMRPIPNAAVMRWLDAQEATKLYLASTSLAELMAGMARMPDGQRKRGLQHLLATMRREWFHGRILSFDEQAAEAYALLVSLARAKGRAVSIADGQIAAIAHVRGFAVATRDTAPFEAAGVAVINPWEG